MVAAVSARLQVVFRINLDNHVDEKNCCFHQYCYFEVLFVKSRPIAQIRFNDALVAEFPFAEN